MACRSVPLGSDGAPIPGSTSRPCVLSGFPHTGIGKVCVAYSAMQRGTLYTITATGQAATQTAQGQIEVLIVVLGTPLLSIR